MAIITDATGRQLAQAVGGIDTGGLAKDTTLQATNTALGNINTTEQSIASAIAELGQSLGNDKANIDGSNITNPSAFRTNINAQEVITPELVTTWSANKTYVISSQFIKVFKFWKLVVVSFGAEIKVSPVNTILLQELPPAMSAGGNANYFGSITGVNGISSRMRIVGSNMIVDSAISTQQWYSGLFVYFIA